MSFHSRQACPNFCLVQRASNLVVFYPFNQTILLINLERSELEGLINNLLCLFNTLSNHK